MNRALAADLGFMRVVNWRVKAQIKGSDRAGAEHLTPRQVEIARLVSRGLMDKEIAQELQISEETVGFHLRALYKKTETRARTELAMWFLFLSPEAAERRLDIARRFPGRLRSKERRKVAAAGRRQHVRNG